MRRVLGSLAVMALVLSAATTASSFPTDANECTACHAYDPTLAITANPVSCYNGMAWYSLAIENRNAGREGYAIFDSSLNILNGIGTYSSFGLGAGTYTLYGVSNVGSWNLGKANFVNVVSDCPPGTCTDVDNDGYSLEGSVCGPIDCNDANGSIYPGAIEVVGDGVDQDCNRYDLTIVVTKAAYSAKKTALTVTATSANGSAANLQLSGYGPMTWNKRTATWSMTVYTSPKPATVTVYGFEGSVSVLVQ